MGTLQWQRHSSVCRLALRSWSSSTAADFRRFAAGARVGSRESQSASSPRKRQGCSARSEPCGRSCRQLTLLRWDQIQWDLVANYARRTPNGGARPSPRLPIGAREEWVADRGSHSPWEAESNELWQNRNHNFHGKATRPFVFGSVRKKLIALQTKVFSLAFPPRLITLPCLTSTGARIC
jgi:hypothetical protein